MGHHNTDSFGEIQEMGPWPNNAYVDHSALLQQVKHSS